MSRAKRMVSSRTTCVGLLRKRLEALEATMMELLDCSTIEIFRDDPDSPVVFIRPEHLWGKPDAKQVRLQMELKGQYREWFEQLQLLLSDATEELSRDISETDSFVRQWIEKEMSWDLSRDMEGNKAHFRKRIAVFYDVLATLDDPAKARVVLVPDTNALIRCPDPSEYAEVAGGAVYDVVLLPTVLGELDDLKNKPRDEAFREKVNGVIRRIKGWRTQGDWLDGITVNKTVTVRSVAREPNFEKTLSWLDKTNRDDRIIASVLELQRAMPSAAIVLVTIDVNLQNKASAASLPYAEAPESKPAPAKPWEGVVLEGPDGPRYFDWGRRMLAVELEDAALRLTPEFRHEVSELLWQRDDVSPQFALDNDQPMHWVYETDRGRKWKRKLEADLGGQYMVASVRREPPPPKCPECGKRSSAGANNCSECLKTGKVVSLRGG
jgi:PIN domain